MKRLALALIALAWLAIMFAPAYAGEIVYPPNKPESQWKHIGTGAAIGLAGMGLCVEVSRRVASLDTVGCYVFTVGASFAGYWVKERRDQRIYGHGKYLDGRDIAEGVGGAAVGAGLLIPIVGF
jgi:threonine/homoserine efflux transporter RhtA